MPPKNQTQRIDELLGGVTEELLLGNPQQFEDTSIRVERLCWRWCDLTPSSHGGCCPNSFISLSTTIGLRQHRH